MTTPPPSDEADATLGHVLGDALSDGLGGRITQGDHWRERRAEIIARVLPMVYGPMPAAPAWTRCEPLHRAIVRRLHGASLLSCRVRAEPGITFTLQLFLPAGQQPCPVLLHGDACWHYDGDDVIAEVLRRGYGLARFNRVELAPDLPGSPWPTDGAGHPTGAIARWAWGFHRALDALRQIEGVDAGRVAVVGHSRGGKAALLAGALDERIAVTCANDSGAGGAGSFRVLGPGAETLADITRTFGHWFDPGLARWAGRERELPFDQHLLKALVAPRALLTTEALDDPWANPQGTWATHRAALPVFKLLQAGDSAAVAWRDGGHDHRLSDWQTLLDFMDHRLHGAPRPAGLNGMRPPRAPAAA